MGYVHRPFAERRVFRGAVSELPAQAGKDVSRESGKSF
ncbi:MAG: hypothetical protein RLZZ244_241 [Verrucomicrobiota bacterium]|jgi:hypothetical protein